MANKKVWVAKISANLGLLHEYELSPRFDDVLKCQQYIRENLQVIEAYLNNAFTDILLCHNFVNGERQYQLSFGGSFIRCYNIQQRRFADGFDF